MTRLSVSEVHLAHRCPRLLAYLASGAGNAWKSGLSSSGSFPSTLFHNKAARPFHNQACGARPGPIYKALAEAMSRPGAGLEKKISVIMDRWVLQPLLNREGPRLKSDQITALALAVEAWAKVLSGFLGRCVEHSPGIKPEQVFGKPEEMLQADLSLPRGGLVSLEGKMDGLLSDPAAGEAIILEFKGVRPKRADEDLIQIGLYALLLRRQMKAPGGGVVLYLEEEVIEATYSAGTLLELEPNLLELIEKALDIKRKSRRKGKVALPSPDDPALCDVCFFNRDCDSDWGIRQSSRDDQQKTTGDLEARELLKRLASILSDLKLPVEPVGYLIGPRVVRLMIKPDIQKGATVSKIANKANDLQISLALKTPPYIHAEPGFLAVDAPRRRSEPLFLSKVWDMGRINRPNSEAAFPLGVTVEGRVFWADLSSPTMTSILAAGTAGSGKSVLLRSAILGMARNAGPDAVKFTLIDPKLVTFGDLKGLPHLASPLILDIEAAIEALDDLVDRMERRYKSMADKGVVDIADYNQGRDRLAHHVIVIDEYADLMMDLEMRKKTEALVQRLCQKGRAAGFHIILSTQRPDARVVTPLIKANLQLKIALKVTSTANSRIILDEVGAESLMGSGDMLVSGAVPITRLQGPLSTLSDIQAVAKK